MHLLLDRLLERSPRHEAYVPTTGLIVEDGVIRAVLEHDARSFWRKRLGTR